MVTHMKTTIEISDDLLARSKRYARRHGRTLRDVVEEALREKLAAGTRRPFRLKKHSFKGDGAHPSVVEGDWATVRDLIYRLG
jgi:Arc/MetJ family transcription regulator